MNYKPKNKLQSYFNNKAYSTIGNLLKYKPTLSPGKDMRTTNIFRNHIVVDIDLGF